VRTRCVHLFGQQDLAPNFQWFDGEQQQRIILSSLQTVIDSLREPVPAWWGKDELVPARCGSRCCVGMSMPRVPCPIPPAPTEAMNA
jgi:hypothetical protein